MIHYINKLQNLFSLVVVIYAQHSLLQQQNKDKNKHTYMHTNRHYSGDITEG